MNRTKLIIFALVMLFYAGSAFSQVAILLDDEEIPLDILFKNDEDILFIPLKTLCNRLSATYKYNPETKIILLAKDRDTIKLQIDNTLVIVNDEWKYLKSPVQRVGEEIIVPFEAVAGFLGSAVSFRTGVPEPPAPADAPAEHAPMHDHASMSEPVQAQPPKAEPPARAEVYAPDRPAPEFFAPSEKSIFGDITYTPEEEVSLYSIKNRFSLSFFANYYRPDGWNVGGKRLERKFGIGGGLRYGLGSHWALDASIGHWSNTEDDTYFSRPVAGSNRLELIPLNINIICYFMKESRLKPFLGLGLTHFRVEHKYWNSNGERLESKDATTGFNVIGGIEYFFTPNFTMYNFLKYIHADLSLSYTTPPFDYDFNVKLNDFFFGTGFAFWF